MTLFSRLLAYAKRLSLPRRVYCTLRYSDSLISTTPYLVWSCLGLVVFRQIQVQFVNVPVLGYCVGPDRYHWSLGIKFRVQFLEES